MRLLTLLCITLLVATFTAAVSSVNDTYIVLLNNTLSDTEEDLHHEWVKRHHLNAKGWHGDANQSLSSKSVFHRFNLSHRQFRGYIGSFPTDVVQSIRDSPEVISIEQDSIETLSHIEVQLNAPWGLSRTSRRYESTSLASKYIFRYDSRAGQNSTVYVLDTGIDTKHLEFRPGRASWGNNFSDDDLNIDDNGHGTHVAGIIAGKMFGLAKKANVVAVKVFDGEGVGSVSSFIRAVEWVISQHENAGDNARTVINYSASGAVSESRTAIVKAALDSGIVFVTSAGNGGTDACLVGPPNVNKDIAESSSLLVVGAIDSQDQVTDYSNIGPCVNMFAPGTGIRSAYPVNGTNHGSRVLSGTSMATPHVAGVVASLWAATPNWTAARVAQTVARINTETVIGEIYGAQNALAYDLVDELQAII